MALELVEDVLNEMADHAGLRGAHDEHCSADQLCRACWVAHYSTRLNIALAIKREEEEEAALCALAEKEFEEMHRLRDEPVQEWVADEHTF